MRSSVTVVIKVGEMQRQVTISDERLSQLARPGGVVTLEIGNYLTNNDFLILSGRVLSDYAG